MAAQFQLVESEKDIASVASLAHEIWNEHYVNIIGQAQVDYMVEKFQSERAIAEQIAEGYEYYLIEHNGACTGYIGVVPQVDSSSMLLSKIYVQKQSRGHGLGKAAMGFVEELCRKLNITTLWLTVNKHNTRSIAYYQRMGFSNAGPIVQDIGGGFVMDDYKMGKPVDPPGSEPML